MRRGSCIGTRPPTICASRVTGRSLQRVRGELCRVYAALAARKGSRSLRIRALALRAGMPVFHVYTRLLDARRSR